MQCPSLAALLPQPTTSPTAYLPLTFAPVRVPPALVHAAALVSAWGSTSLLRAATLLCRGPFCVATSLLRAHPATPRRPLGNTHHACPPPAQTLNFQTLSPLLQTCPRKPAQRRHTRRIANIRCEREGEPERETWDGEGGGEKDTQTFAMDLVTLAMGFVILALGRLALAMGPLILAVGPATSTVGLVSFAMAFAI